MIEARELRVGNRFVRQMHSTRGLDYRHFELTEEWMGKLFGNYKLLALQDLFPIPLSAEILYRCRFVKADTSNEYWSHWRLENGWHISEAHHTEPSAGVTKGLFY